jgi:hypothetical protein
MMEEPFGIKRIDGYVTGLNEKPFEEKRPSFSFVKVIAAVALAIWVIFFLFKGGGLEMINERLVEDKAFNDAEYACDTSEAVQARALKPGGTIDDYKLEKRVLEMEKERLDERRKVLQSDYGKIRDIKDLAKAQEESERVARVLDEYNQDLEDYNKSLDEYKSRLILFNKRMADYEKFLEENCKD